MKNFYFTFPYGSSFNNAYVKIKAENWYEARAKMVEVYGKNWSFQYSEDTFLEQIDKYDLHEVDFGTKFD